MKKSNFCFLGLIGSWIYRLDLILVMTIMLCHIPDAKAQSSIDSLLSLLANEKDEVNRALIAQQLSDLYLYRDGDSCKMYSAMAYNISAKLGIDSLHAVSVLDLAQSYIVLDKLDSSKILLHANLDFLKKSEQFGTLAAAYRTLAQIGEIEYEPDTIIHYLQKCEIVLLAHPDSAILGDVFLSKGLAYNIKGYYQMATEELLNSARIFEKLENLNRQHLVLLNLGVTYGHRSDYKKCLEVLEPPRAYFGEKDRPRFMAHIENNLGVTFEELGRLEESVEAYSNAIRFAQISKQPFVEQNAKYNLGELYFDDLNIPDSSLKYLDLALVLANELEDGYIQGSSLVYKSKIALNRGQRSKALAYAEQAESYIREFPSLKDQGELWRQLSDVYEGMNLTGKALTYHKLSVDMTDSLYNDEVERQAEELSVIYETEKKDAEILLLNKQTELDATRKKALWGGMLLLSLLGGSVIYSQVQRRKKEKAILIGQKEAEVQKRQLAEQELEFKKKELTAKALQLARKNEFLLNLETEVNELKSTVDSSVNKASQRISRMITRDADDNEEWDQFGKEFSSIHQDFLDRLRSQFGSFSKSEMRLIALLKMNLSSKDIANTLRISGEGVKKARYRLRKKMGLNSEQDIQDYLLGY